MLMFVVRVRYYAHYFSTNALSEILCISLVAVIYLF